MLAKAALRSKNLVAKHARWCFMPTSLPNMMKLAVESLVDIVSYLQVELNCLTITF